MTKISIIGFPLKKSLSYLIFSKLSKLIKEEIIFEKIETKKIKKDIVKYIKNNYDGLFITMPHKTSFFKYTLPDKISAKLNVINCVKIKNKNLYSTNTDYKALKYLLKPYVIKGKTAIILGNGSTAYISTHLLIEKGIKKIILSVRNKRKLQKIKKLLNEKKIKYSTITFPRIKTCDILINCTPLGMYFNKKLNIKNKNIKLIIDFAYKKSETPLIKYAKKNNIDTITGINILLLQALYGFEFIKGIKVKKYYQILLKQI